MVFSSAAFLFAFLPLTLAGYYFLPRKCRNYFLMLASLLFYAWGEPKFVFVMILSILMNYAFGLLVDKYRQSKKQKLVLTAMVITNLSVFFVFKYLNFTIENLNILFRGAIPQTHIALPIGISFFTFQAMSYVFDVAMERGEVQKNPFNVALYISLFPQLIAGPIVRYQTVAEEIQNRRETLSDFVKGTRRFCVGLAKKMILSNSVALLADQAFGYADAAQLSAAMAWLGVLAYAFQIYFDFGGYSDMAIGLGKMFNIDLPYNFLSPYQSESFTVFWRRWHITLGRALSSYIYKPLGGSRRGRARTFLNTMATFLISGLWHGAAWTFVLWGGIHGLFVAGEKLLGDRLERIPKALRVGLTFLLVNVLWVLFRAESFSQAGMVYSGMLSFGSLNLGQLAALVLDNAFDFPTIVDIAYLFSLLAVLLAVVFRCRNTRELLENFRCSGKSLAFTVFLFCFSVIHLSRGSIFIYFNF